MTDRKSSENQGEKPDITQEIQSIYSFEKGEIVPFTPLTQVQQIQLQHRVKTCACCFLYGEL